MIENEPNEYSNIVITMKTINKLKVQHYSELQIIGAPL